MWARLRSFVRALTRRDQFEDSLSEELRFHLTTYADDLIAQGTPRKEAYRQARLRFGSVERVRDECRQARGLRLVDELGRDIRDGVRSLRKRPLFAVMAVVSLAIGIGAMTTSFSLVNAVLLRERPLERPDELVHLYMHHPSFPFGPVSYPELADIRDATVDVFSDIGATRLTPALIEGDRGGDVVFAETVTGSYFPMLGINAALGRTIRPEDDVSPGSHPVVLLGHGFWQQHFGGDPNVLGETLRVAGRAYHVIGVAPPDFPGSFPGLVPAFYGPSMMSDALLGVPLLDNRGNRTVFASARLRPGVSLPQVETALAAVAADLTAAHPNEWDRAQALGAMPIHDVLVYPSFDPYIRAGAWVLMLAAGLVLVLACANLASLLLARAFDQRRDVAVRLALGASRQSLVRRLLIETTLLGVLGGAAGLGITAGLLRLAQRVDLPLPVEVTFAPTIDWTVLGFTVAVSVIAGGVLGLVPALRGTRAAVASTLKRETPGGSHPGHLRWRNGLVIAQLTASLVLLVGAGLFVRSAERLRAVDPGFGRDPTALMTFMVPTTRFTPDEGRRYTRQLLEHVRQLPEVTAAGVIDLLHLTFYSNQSTKVNVDGFEPPADDGAFVANHVRVDPGFFDAAGIQILRGRTFTDADRADTHPVTIISETMARRFWPGGDAIGRLIRRERDQTNLRVVGVAGDVKVRSLGEDPRLVIYLPYSQAYSPVLTLIARTTTNPVSAAAALVAAGRAFDPDLWVGDANTMEAHLAMTQVPAQLSAVVVSVFGVLALSLAVLGLYGVVSYVVAARTREVGLRMALGADARAVVRLLTVSGARLVLVGGAMGLVLALAGTRAVRGLLFGVGPLDPVAFLAAVLVLGAVTLLAAYVPARRASRIDPNAALRVD